MVVRLVAPGLHSELYEAGAHISPKLAEDEHWKNYLSYAIRNRMVLTHQDVGILAYGFEAGSRREIW